MPSMRVLNKSRSERGLASEPGPRRLELGAQANQRRFIAETPDQLHCQRQAAPALTQRQHEAGLAGEIEPYREWREIEYPAPVFVHIVHHHVEPAQFHGRRT